LRRADLLAVPSVTERRLGAPIATLAGGAATRTRSGTEDRLEDRGQRSHNLERVNARLCAVTERVPALDVSVDMRGTVT
jgi:hypothetical protein